MWSTALVVSLGAVAGAAARTDPDDSAAPPELVSVVGQKRNGLVPKQSDAATKTDTPLIETPESVSVVTRDQLDQQNARTVAEALR